MQSVRGAAARGWSIFLLVYPMTLTAPIPLWLDLGPIPTLTTTAARRQILTDTGALVLLGDLTGFTAIFRAGPQPFTAADPPWRAAAKPRHRAPDGTRTAT